MQAFLRTLRKSDMYLFLIIYLSFLLDNVLLTVVVPIIPDYLFSSNINETRNVKSGSLRPASLSYLQQKFETLEYDNGPLGTLLASKAFVQLAVTPVVCYLIGVFGCEVPLLLGSCIMLVASILFAYGNTYTTLVLARALHGSSSATISVSGMSMLAKFVPKDLRTRIMPLAFGGIAVGVLIGYPLGGATYQTFGKTAPFLFIAFFIFINIILQLFYFEEEAIDENQRGEIHYMEWFYLLKNKQVLIATSTICICTSTMAILEPCVPMWLLAHSSPPPSRWQLGAVFIPDSIGYFIGSHFSGLLPVTSWRIAFSALVLAGISCCFLPSANSISLLAVPHFGLGLSVGAVDAALVPLLANLVDKQGSNQYGPVYALQQAFVSLAYAFAPLVGGRCVRIFGFPWLMRIIGFMNLFMCPFLLDLGNVKTSFYESY